jgi:hypothetical protein
MRWCEVTFQFLVWHRLSNRSCLIHWFTEGTMKCQQWDRWARCDPSDCIWLNEIESRLELFSGISMYRSVFIPSHPDDHQNVRVSVATYIASNRLIQTTAEINEWIQYIQFLRTSMFLCSCLTTVANHAMSASSLSSPPKFNTDFVLHLSEWLWVTCDPPLTSQKGTIQPCNHNGDIDMFWK